MPGATENSTNANVADDSRPAGRGASGHSASGHSASGRGETIAKLGTVLSAIMASSCCWLPPLLIVAGVSGAGIVAALETYRPLFMFVTFSFLGAAFYFTYRPRRGAAQEDCCEPAKSGRGRFNMMAVNKAMLWAVTVMAVVFLFFPQYVTALVAPDHGQLTADMDRATVAVEGMTCPG